MSELIKVLLDGGPLHGVRAVTAGLQGFAVTTATGIGAYCMIGVTEAGYPLFKWTGEEEADDRTEA